MSQHTIAGEICDTHDAHGHDHGIYYCAYVDKPSGRKKKGATPWAYNRKKISPLGCLSTAHGVHDVCQVGERSTFSVPAL